MHPTSSARPDGVPNALAFALAQRLAASRDRLAQEWLERIVERVTMPANRMFPTHELLDHVPRLIEGIAHYVEEPSNELTTDSAVEAEATALGRLRHSQGFDANQILKEYEILGDILFHHLGDGVDNIEPPCAPSDVLQCARHLFHAIVAVEETTTQQFLRLADARVMDRESRLRAFNRMVSHEIRNDLGVIIGAIDLLDGADPGDVAQLNELHEAVRQRARTMKATLDRLFELSHVEVEAHTPRHVRLPEVLKVAVSRVQDKAKASHVDMRVAAEIPEVEVNAAVVEFALANYLSNAIKYARRGSRDAFVEVRASEAAPRNRREVVVSVLDNGMGVAPDRRSHLFERFYRAHTDTENVEGTGMGLSLVREMIESVGGWAWAEFPNGHTVFSFTLPLG